MFAPDRAFLATSHPIAELSLCHARLQDDARYPWIVLIPRVEGARELEDLSGEDLSRLMDEVLAAGRAVRRLGPVEKLNVGALGNVTPQLHVHVVGRRAGDPAWPGPVWGHSAALAYPARDLAPLIALAREALSA